MKFKYWIMVTTMLIIFIGTFASSMKSNPETDSFLANIREFESAKFTTPTPEIESLLIPSAMPTTANVPAITRTPRAASPELAAVDDDFIPQIAFEEGGPRGYMTTPDELMEVARKAASSKEPYRSAVNGLMEYVSYADYWPYGSISGKQNCKEPLEPAFIGEGAPLVFAKALAYHITGNTDYAESVKMLLLDLTDTNGFGGEKYSGGNQCILNLSWYIPNWIIAADLIEDYSNWTKTDKAMFQTWLAQEVYKKTAWSSRERRNNWGSAGSAASGMIADYVWDSSLLLEGASPHAAYLEHKENQLDRLNTQKEFDSPCSKWGIQPDGAIPDELKRGSSGCNAKWIKKDDGSYTYTMTFLQGAVMHAEFLLRRGDSSLYDNMAEDGSGSILRAIHFVIDNQADSGKSHDWRSSAKPTLEVTFRYYRDRATARQLGFGTADRYIGGKSNPMLHFGTITHGFSPDENPGLPPTVPPP